MAAFSSKSFDASSYKSARPTYPPHCQAARALAGMFDSVVGVDPSETMLDAARKEGGKTKAGQEVRWEVASSDQLAFLKDASVDVVTAGARGALVSSYFKYPETLHEFSRVLKPHGIVAFFNYTRLRLGQPLTALNPIIDHHVALVNAASDIHGLAQAVIMSLSPPSDLFEIATLERHLYVGEHYPPEHFDAREEVIMSGKSTWEQMEAFYRSGGATHKWFEMHPEDRENPEGDAITRMMNEVRGEAEKMGYKGEEVTVEHPMVLLMFRKL
ncbi:hypothetical protein CALCODRAFT_510081 [Calocera cornea HHB12733]|uniref:Methyltransferase type 11 domain-containing protein n=1 Tax=Calocera cornea HHB12733 TaxID=1353952 RepID=A0A165ESW2_9BASI|nr:hypothetical protein CALCODRAFT_510081 [Calocera cornea HHB12733]